MKISIITATLNAEATLGKCIQRVIDSDLPNYEHIIMDGQSSDKTIAIAESFNSPQLKIHQGNDAGVYDAFNQGLKLATGDYIAFIGADDFYVDGALQKVLEAINKTSTPSLFHGDIVIKQRPAPIKPWIGLLSFKQTRIFHPTSFTHRSIFFDVGNFNIAYKIAADLDFFFRAKQKTPFTYLNTPITHFALGGTSTQSAKATNAEITTILKAHNNASSLIAYFKIYEYLKSIVKHLFKRKENQQHANNTLPKSPKGN